MITWNDSLYIHCIPDVYMCEVCKNRIQDKQCRAIRINWPNGTTSNHYFHDRHVAISYADWFHKINEQLKANGKQKSI